MIIPGLVASGRGAVRAADAQGTPTQSFISPSVLVYEDCVPDSRFIRESGT